MSRTLFAKLRTLLNLFPVGGWTLIYRAIFQTSDKEILPATFVDNYRNISDYGQNQLVPVTVLNQLRQDMGFNQMRFYCHKKLVSRTVHIMTKGSLEGEMVIRYFTNSTERPVSCGSFTVLPDDISIASQQCSQWGIDSQGSMDQKWGTDRNKGENRLNIEPVFARLGSKHILILHRSFHFCTVMTIGIIVYSIRLEIRGLFLYADSEPISPKSSKPGKGMKTLLTGIKHIS